MRNLLLIAFCLVASSVFAEENTRKSAQIYTPEGICTTLKSLDGDKVYLVTRKGRCKSTSIPIMVDEDIFKASIYLDEKPWQEQSLVAAAVPDMAGMQAEARKMAGDIKMPDLEKNRAAVEAGRKVGEYMNSEVYQARVMAEVDRVREEVFNEKDTLKKFYPDTKGDGIKRGTTGVLGSGERVYVFISSSMPLDTLRNYAMSIDRANDPNVVMVMRGMIGGIAKMIPTMEFIGKIIIKDQTCLARSMQSGGAIECDTYGAEVLVDPMLFSRYNIVNVPAVVYAKGVKAYDPESSEGFEGNTQVDSSKTIYGDAALDAILETMADNTKSKSLEALVKKMRGGYYN